MPWRSVYFEASCDDRKRVLREGGSGRSRACPRWDTSGGDIYGNSPGMEALGDIKQLQHQQLRKGQAIDYQVRPPLQLPPSMRNQEGNFRRGAQLRGQPGRCGWNLISVGRELAPGLPAAGHAGRSAAHQQRSRPTCS